MKKENANLVMQRLELFETLLRSYQFNFSGEDELQHAVEEVLKENKIFFEREYQLSTKDRIDFLIGGDIGLEIKVAFSYADVIRQLHRYAQSDEISALVLLTSRLQHVMPKEINKKTLCTVNISLISSL